MGTHPIFESDFDCLTEGRICQFCVEFTVKPDKVDAFYEEFNKCVAISVKEAGCKQYQTFKDFKNPTTVWLLEEWDSVADLKAHMLAQQSSGIPNLDGILAAGL